MKKLLLVLVFSFIGQQVFCQMYIATLSKVDPIVSGCDGNIEATLTITDPSGGQTYTCITVNNWNSTSGLSVLNTKLNDIITTSPGYKLIEVKTGDKGFMENDYFTEGTVWFFAVP
tara:strand:+ start:240 stop:587 length:348 start_codon:yes stop_codon:yes gene_type:complete